MPRFHLLSLIISLIVNAHAFFAVNWSSASYGPDGPWNAITIDVGGNQSSSDIASEQSSVDLFVGSWYASYIPSSSACRPYGPQCGKGGVWEPDTSVPSLSPPNIWDAPAAIRVSGTVYPTAVTIGTEENRQTIYDVDIASIDSFSVTYPNQQKAAVELGFFALNAGMSQDTGQASSNGSVSPWVVAGYLYEKAIIPSYSYGLHLGSAALSYGGSLLLGGYDKGRVIGPYASSAGYDIRLLDISLGVETGDSPFSFGNASNLLVNARGQAKPITVKPDPMPPGLHLPPQTCSTLAEKLPVYFDEDTGYYLWNVSDPLYEKIISSPAYLGFHFNPAPDNDANVTIKIPFQLLNLTLTSPVVSSPVQYFPCIPFTKPSADIWRLGRAFLQGAFLGYNTQTNTMWLAQAPGPGSSEQTTAYEPQNLTDDARTLDAYNDPDMFRRSWAAHWTPLNETNNSNPGTANSTTGNPGIEDHQVEHNSLSGGAIAGIVIGVVVGVLLIAAIVFRVLRARSKRHNAAKEPTVEAEKEPSTREESTIYTEMSNETEVQELPSQTVVKELPAQREAHELESPWSGLQISKPFDRLFGNILTLVSINRLGRRLIQINGFFWLFVLFFVIDTSSEALMKSQRSSVIVVLYILTQIFFNFGPNTTTYIIPAEVFPNRYRYTAHGISAAFGKLGAVVAQCFLGWVHLHGKIYIIVFSAFMLVGLALTVYWIPRSRDKNGHVFTLEELAQGRLPKTE